MRIGILGAGNIGGALGKRWAAGAHEIVFGVRDAQSYTVQILMNGLGANARTGSLHEAADFGEVVVLAVPWLTVPEVLAAAGPLTGKILVDCTNRLPPVAAGSAPSGAEEIARRVPGARVVKAFNTLGAEHIAHLPFGPPAPSTFVCGDDPDARTVTCQLGEEIGFDVVEVGPLSTAPLVEGLGALWVQLAGRLGRDIAFALLRRTRV